MDWRVSIIHFPANFSDIWRVIQLKDSGYLVIGDQIDRKGQAVAFATRLSALGAVKWEHTYFVDSSQHNYLVDVKERQDGGFVLVGWTKGCATCSQDVWLLGIDSNGCELPGCDNGLAVPRGATIPSAFDIYPNPTTGSVTIDISQAGQFSIYDLLGKRISVAALQAGKSTLHLPGTLSPGVYIGQYHSDDGKSLQLTRIIYQP